MSPKSAAQFEAIRENKKYLIKATAMELFANKGYNNTSIHMIATAANISKGLMYNYFKSKEKLLKEIIFEQFDLFIDLFDTNKDGILEQEELKYFIHEVFELMKKNPKFWQLYFSLFMQQNVMHIIEDRAMEILGSLQQKSNAYFSRQGYEKPEVWTRYLASVLDGIGMHFILDPKNYPIHEIEKIVLHTFCQNNNPSQS